MSVHRVMVHVFKRMSSSRFDDVMETDIDGIRKML